MGIPVMIMGESGAGKSTSLRNFEYGEIGVLNVAGKPLPFRGRQLVNNNVNYESIRKSLQNPHLNCFVIDDSQALMAFEMFGRAQEKGYDKFTSIAVNFYNLVKFIIEQTPPDCIVYLLHHTEQTDTGKIKAKTVGKMLDNQLTLEGLFSIVLLARTDGNDHWFDTQSDGQTTCKSPMEMLPSRMDNDLKQVDNAIREYWRLAARKKFDPSPKNEAKADAPREDAA